MVPRFAPCVAHPKSGWINATATTGDGGGGDGFGGGGGGNIAGVVVPQMIQPPLVTEPSEYQLIVAPAAIWTLAGPAPPE